MIKKTPKQIVLLLSFILFSIFLINFVSACDKECYSDNGCEDDYYSDKYCSGEDVYQDFHDFFCRNYKCKEDIFDELVRDCGNDKSGEWDYYCEGDDVRRDRTNYLRGCSRGSCYETEDYEDEYVNTCDYDCVSGECIDEPEPFCGDDNLDVGEECDDGNTEDNDGCSSTCEIEEIICYTNSDCGTDQCAGGPNYCGLDNNVYQGFIVYTCNNPGLFTSFCSNDIVPWLLDTCGNDKSGEWDYYCEGDDVRRDRTNYLRGCSSGSCYETEAYEDEYVNTCVYDCVSGECIDELEPFCGNSIEEEGEECDDGNLDNGDGCSSTCEIEEDDPECCNDSDCDDDYYSDKYCSGGDVYKDFYDYFCLDGECDFNMTKQLFDECDSDEDCENGKCVDEDDDDDDHNDRSCCYGDDCDDLCFIGNREIENVMVLSDGIQDLSAQEDIVLSSKQPKEVQNNFWLIILLIGILVLIILIILFNRG